MRINKPLFIFILASLVAHAAFLTLCYMAPPAEPEDKTGFGDCFEPSVEQPGSSGADLGPKGTGGVSVAGGVALGSSSIGSGAALGPRITIRTEAVFWPCCGPGCRSEIADPE